MTLPSRSWWSGPTFWLPIMPPTQVWPMAVCTRKAKSSRIELTGRQTKVALRV